MFACHVQGVPGKQVGPAVAEVIARVSLPVEMSDRASGQLSGGNKRKLALGIALVGGTSALLLDEPSSGMVWLPADKAFHACNLCVELDSEPYCPWLRWP